MCVEEAMVCISVCLCAGRGCGEGLVCRDSGLTPGYGFVNYDNFFASVRSPSAPSNPYPNPNPNPNPNQVLTTFSVI